MTTPCIPCEAAEAAQRRTRIRGLGASLTALGQDPLAPSQAAALGRAYWRLGAHVGGLSLAAAGGALTGALAAGSWEGAGVGAATHIGLVGLLGAVAGPGFTTVERGVYAALAFGAGAVATYLVLQR